MYHGYNSDSIYIISVYKIYSYIYVYVYVYVYSAMNPEKYKMATSHFLFDNVTVQNGGTHMLVYLSLIIYVTFLSSCVLICLL